MLELGLTNLRELSNETGRDWREILKQRATEESFAEDVDVILPWMEGRTAAVSPSESRPHVPEPKLSIPEVLYYETSEK